MQQNEKKVILDASVRGKRMYVKQNVQETQAQEAAPKKQQNEGQKKQQPQQRQQAQKKPPQGDSLKQQPAKRGRPRKQELEPVKVTFLGGMNEVGKNLTAYEFRGDIIIVDCGLAFPDAETPGIDLIIPDFSWLEQNAEKIRGIVITHGHEDHIGGLAYLLKRINAPVYSAKLTLGLIRGKLKEHRIQEKTRLIEVHAGQTIPLGQFMVETIHVNHSIPDAFALAITCEAGTIIQTGDFKIDTTPIDGDMIDLARLSRYGKKGVLALLSDSTNAERPGYTMSESKVGESFDTLFRRAENRRILVATFSSNVHRVQQIMDVAAQLGRKVALLGRSLENVVSVGTDLGYLHIPEGLVIPIDMIQRYTHEQIVIITTGSQGEPMSALTRMAFSDHRKVEIGPQDCVIISATPIPGNEKTVGKVVNELLKLGAMVVYEKMYDVHVSGHACQEELKIMLGITKPRYFIPVHGEQKHLVKHAQLAQSMGMNPHNIMIADNGIQLELTTDEMKVAEPVPAGSVFVDGSGVGDVGAVVLRDRRWLSQEGMIIVAVTVDRTNGQIISGPEILSKGFVYAKESEDLLQETRELAVRVIEDTPLRNRTDWNSLRGKLREEIARLMHERTKRSPLVLIVLMEG